MSPHEHLAWELAMKAEMCDVWHYANNPSARDRVNKTAKAVTAALAASAAKEPDPWGVQHLPGLRDGSARVCINAKHGDSSDCGVCVVCQRLALTAKLEASALALQKAAKAIENHRCRSSPTWCSTHAIYHGDELCSALAKP